MSVGSLVKLVEESRHSVMRKCRNNKTYGRLVFGLNCDRLPNIASGWFINDSSTKIKVAATAAILCTILQNSGTRGRHEYEVAFPKHGKLAMGEDNEVPR